MKATGIIRRMDDLGRIVIPREIRRRLRIREGDALELFVEDDKVIWKKYSMLDEITDRVQVYADVLNKVMQKTIILCDPDRLIAVKGMPKKELMGLQTSEEMIDILRSRREYRWNGRDTFLVNPLTGSDVLATAIVPITDQGDLVGCIALVAEENPTVVSDAEMTLLTTTAMLLGSELKAE